MPGSGDRRRGLGLDPRPPATVPVPRSGAPYLIPIAVAIAAAAALWLGRERLGGLGAASWQSPETQVRQALAQQNRAHLADVYGFKAGGTAELLPLRFFEPAISVEGSHATVAAMLDGEGRVTWRDESATLRYLGREKFHMHSCAIALWCGEGDQFERLRGVLSALFRHHDAALARDLTALAPLVSPAYDDRGERREALLARLQREWVPASPTRIRAWQIRVERETAEVGEDVTLGGGGEARAHYRLAWDGSHWAFVSGL